MCEVMTDAFAEQIGQSEESLEKTYTIKGLAAKDIFPMVKVIKKIGLKDFGKCFEPEEIRSITDAFENKEEPDSMAEVVGASVVFKIVDVILENLPKAEQEIYTFLAGITDLSTEGIANLPMDAFFELIIDVFKRKEFTGFMKVVSRSLK